MPIDEHRRVNLENWEDRVPIHASSQTYDLAGLANDPNGLTRVIQRDRERMPSVAGKDVVHLQCHIGTDTVSLARLGARMTGLDLSGESVSQARRLAEAAGSDVEYVVSDVYAAQEALGARTFDLVYVSVGALSWLPSVDRWAGVVDALLRPGGRLFLRDSHPMLDTLELDPETRIPVPTWPYFEHPDPVVWNEEGTYVSIADGDEHTITHTEVHTWSHALGETVTALLRRGLVLTRLEEHDSVPFCPFPGIMTKDELGEYRLTDRPGRIAMSFTLEARKPPR
jgi:SAM-dependent methyltransferase